MRKATVIVLTVLLMAATTMAAEGKKAKWLEDDYIIGPGDTLEISVWKDPELTKTVTVLPDGKFSFPLIGEVKAGGKTVAELHKELKAGLDRFVPDVNLHVGVQQVNSMLIYVIGYAKSPGRYALNANVNVLQALTMAGGLDEFADQDGIKIFRQAGAQTQILNFDYKAVIDGKNLEQNIILQRGDIIVVP
jgi:polysaccharide export outer membrane protein